MRRMVRDLNVPGEIVVVPTVREADGLAMSSRNTYLSAEQRQAAPVVYRALTTAMESYRSGRHGPMRCGIPSSPPWPLSHSWPPSTIFPSLIL